MTNETFKTAELVREINKTSALIVVEHDMNFIRAMAILYIVSSRINFYGRQYGYDLCRSACKRNLSQTQT